MIIPSSFCLRSCCNINDDDDDEETFQLIITLHPSWDLLKSWHLTQRGNVLQHVAVHASSSILTVSACALGAGCFHCI